MKVFKTLEEMQPFYNENTDTYEFIEDGERIDINIDCNIHVGSNIIALDITAKSINAWDITARNINARNIDALDINARDITAADINVLDITARNISYYAICIARENFTCKSVIGRRKNAKHLCLDSEIVFTAYKNPIVTTSI